MSRVEDDITQQLHLCAALMSDPLIMREQSGFVADQFLTAMQRIEQLQDLLRQPADPCARHNWLDSSIIIKGVKRMVGLVLSKHMEPLRWKTPKQLREAKARGDRVVEGSHNAAPQVFSRAFQEEGDHACGESYMAREIKETNCIASIVLLYYYLYWHVLLITLNHINHPCIEGKEVQSPVDIDRLLKGLPGFADTFELRPLRSFMRKNHADDKPGSESDCYSSDEDDSFEGGSDSESKPDGGGPKLRSGRMEAYRLKVKALLEPMLKLDTLNEFMSSLYPDEGVPTLPPNNPHRKPRKGNLVGVYRMVIALTHWSDAEDYFLNNAFVASCGAFDPSIAVKASRYTDDYSLRDGLLVDLNLKIFKSRAATSGMEELLNQKVHSVYTLQEDSQRWFDLYRSFEVSCIIDDSGKEFGAQPTRKRFSPVLATVLNNWPYEKVFNGDKSAVVKALCINDFNTSSLMMDVVRSLLKLHELLLELRAGNLRQDLIRKNFYLFIMQTYFHDKTFTKFIKSEMESGVVMDGYVRSTLKTCGWLSVPLGNHKKVCKVQDMTFDDCVVDEIAGHYWGSVPSNFRNVNHRYIAWPTAEAGDYKRVLKLIQPMLYKNNSVKEYDNQFLMIIEPALRNSLFIQPVIESLLLLIASLECTPIFDDSFVSVNSDVLMYGQIPDSNVITDLSDAYEDEDHNEPAAESGVKKDGIGEGEAAESIGGGGSVHTLDAFETADNIDMSRRDIYINEKFQKLKSFIRVNRKLKVNKKKLVSDMRAELLALETRVLAASKGEFKLYSGTSWPVISSVEAENNVAHFGEGVPVPRQLGTRTENALEYIADTFTKKSGK